MTGPLAQVRVVDLTSVVMGPMATQILGDLGADVITIESARGDTNRVMGTGPVPQLSDISLNLLRNKRNVALNLKHPDGIEALLRITATADVFVTNLRPAPLARLGLSYEGVTAARPDIVYCRAQGFPSESTRANEPAYDDIIQAAAGVPDVVRRAGFDPSMVPTLLGDKVSGLVVVYAILAALFHRERTGEGQCIEVPMVDALSSFLMVEHSAGIATHSTEEQGGYRRILTPFRGPKRTSDSWIAVFPYLQSHWDAMLHEGGASELVGDPRLSHVGRNNDPGFGYGVLADLLVTRTTQEWLTFCSSHSIPASDVANIEAIAQNYPDAQHPVAGTYKTIPSPVRFSATPSSLSRPAPLIGQHNSEVLLEVGYSIDDVRRFESDGVVRNE